METSTTGPSQPRWLMVLLALTFTGVLGVLGKTLVAPASPERAPLPGLAAVYSLDSDALAAAVTLEVAESNSFTSNSRRFQRDAAIARNYGPPRIRRGSRGSYVLSRDRTAEYLTACLTPQGQSLGSYEDYLRHSHSQRVNPGRLLGWLLGLGSVRDARCLWVALSLPLTVGDAAQRQHRLENSFVDLLGSGSP